MAAPASSTTFASGRMERGGDETVDRINPADLEMGTAANVNQYFSDKVIIPDEVLSYRDPEPDLNKEMRDILKPLPASEDYLCLLPTDKKAYKVGILEKPKPEDGYASDDDGTVSDYKDFPRLPDPTNERERPLRRYWVNGAKYDPKKPPMYNPPRLFNTRVIQAHEEHAMATWRGDLRSDETEPDESDDEDTLLRCSLEQLAVERANGIIGNVSLEEHEARAQYHAAPDSFSADTFVPRPQQFVRGPNPTVGIFDLAEAHMHFEKARQEEIKWVEKNGGSRESNDANVFNRTGNTSEQLDYKALRATRMLHAQGKVVPPPLPKGIAKPKRKSRKAFSTLSNVTRRFSEDPAMRDAQVDALLAATTVSGEEITDEKNLAQWKDFVSAMKRPRSERFAGSVPLSLPPENAPEPEPMDIDGAEVAVSTPTTVQPWVQPSPTPRSSYARARSARQRRAPRRYER